MNIAKNKNQTMRHSIRRILPKAAAILLLIVVMAFPAAAAELVAESPSGTYQNGDVITIPIILKNDVNFVGFSAKINNDINGVTVTIGDAQPIEGATYQVNSKESNSEQQINAAFFKAPQMNTGISDENIHLFDMNVVINDASVTSVPLSVTLRELIAIDGSGELVEIPVETVKQINLQNLKLTEKATGSVTSQGKADPIPSQSVFLPSQSTPVQNTPQETSNPAPVQQPQSSPVTPQGESTQTSSPGFGAAVITIGLLGAALLVRKRS